MRIASRATALALLSVLVMVMVAESGSPSGGGRIAHGSHIPTSPVYAIDTDPTGAVSGTVPQAYVPDPNGDGKPEDNSLTAGTVDFCIQVPAGTEEATVNVVAMNMTNAVFYDIAPAPNGDGAITGADLQLVAAQSGKLCITSVFTYNGDGLRTARRSSRALDMRSTSDVAAGLPVILREQDLHNTLDGHGTDNTYVYGLDVISVTDRTGVQTYFVSDGLGSTANLTDGSGNTSATYIYDVFGAMRSESGTGAAANEWRGEQRDQPPYGGIFYYLRARYYDPSIGRFLTADPLPGLAISPQTQNRYAYVANNPVNRIDPLGLLSERSLSVGLDGLLKARSCGEATRDLILGVAYILGGATLWTAGGFTGPSLFLGSPAVVIGTILFIRGYRGYLENC